MVTVSSKDRNAKSIEQKLVDLDAHIYLLRQHLHKLRDSKSHLKVIAAELRTLVCKSSGTEGLLWRLADELKVGDLVALHLPGKLKQDHPLVRGLEFMIVPIFRAGKGDPRLVPGNYSFRAVIKDTEALVALGKPLTHEYLIKAVAQQMGTAHEDDGLEPALVQLSAIFVNGVEPYLGVLAMDAELTLEVGERVLEVAESRGLLHRPSHSHDQGNVSVVVRVCRKQHLDSRVQLFRFHSYTSGVTVIGLATPTGVLFQLSKRKQPIVELLAPYPESCTLGEDAIAVLSYCSRTGEVSNRSSQPSEWCGVFCKYPMYVTLHYKDDRRLYGWPEVWPSDPEKGHFFIVFPVWLHGESPAPMPEVEGILVDVRDVKHVEFVKDQ